MRICDCNTGPRLGLGLSEVKVFNRSSSSDHELDPDDNELRIDWFNDNGIHSKDFYLKNYECLSLMIYLLQSFSVRAFWESVNSQSDSLSVSTFSSGLNDLIITELWDYVIILTASKPPRKSSNL